MAENSKIEWTDATWPVVKGCDYVSPGCANCYAVDLIHRHSHNPNPKISLPLAGLTEVRNGRARWTGKVYLNEPHLTDPLKWKRGRMIFVPSHGDLFHKDVPDEFIDRVFAVMALAPQHTFQVLTKRPERMKKYWRSLGRQNAIDDAKCELMGEMPDAGRNVDAYIGEEDSGYFEYGHLGNVWLGTSVENQAAADERIPHLLQTPAAVRFLSCEPLLGPVNLRQINLQRDCPKYDSLKGILDFTGQRGPSIDWIICGGESGHGARPCRVEWVRSLVQQCKAAGAACFVKQLGSNSTANYYDDFREEWENQRGLEWPESIDWNHRDGQPPLTARVSLPLAKKGGVFDEFPADLRVRQFPEVRHAARV